MGIRRGQVEHRRDVDGDAELAQFRRHQAGVEVDGLGRAPGVGAGDVEELHGGRHRPPMRWRQPADASAFLVDEDVDVLPADRFLQLADQLAELLRVTAVAAVEDEAVGIGLAEEAEFRGAERVARATEYRRRWSPRSVQARHVRIPQNTRLFPYDAGPTG